MSVLSEEDRAFWNENGYIVIHDAVSRENIKAAEDAIWNFLGMRPDNQESWYPDPPRRGIMAEMYQHQALWDNRQYPRVHQAFAEVLGMEQLWVSIDRVSMSPPERTPPNDTSSKQPIPLHWDYVLQLHGDGKPTLMEGSLERPLPFWVQGVLYLTDTVENGGAFTSVPGFHREIEGWLETLPQVADPRKRDESGGVFLNYDAWLETLPANDDSSVQAIIDRGTKPVPAKAGDLIIWHSSLPHGASYNTANHPRVVQYMTMFPAQENDDTARNRRIKVWQNGMAAEGHSMDHSAELSPLGRKLLGLDRWD